MDEPRPKIKRAGERGRGCGDECTRDCTVARLAGHLLRRRIDPFVVLELLKSWNATHCRPPLAVADIERVCASIAARELKRRQHGAG